VDARGADADLGPQAEHAAVVQARRGVDQHRGRVHLAHEAHGRGVIAGDDGLGVVRAVALDVGGRLIERRHHLHRQIQAQPLRVVVPVLRRDRAGHEGPAARAGVDGHPGARQALAQGRQHLVRHVLVDEQGLHGVADPGPLDLGVVGDVDRHGGVGGPVHVGVAQALVVLDHGDAAVLGDHADQPLAAARDDQVDGLGLPQQVRHCIPVGGLEQGDGVVRQARLVPGALQDAGDGGVRMDRLRPPLEHHPVAALEAQGGGVGRDVGARLVHDPDHPDGHPHPPHQEAPGAAGHVGDLPHRVGKRGDFQQAVGHGLNPGAVQGEAVEHGVGQALLPAGGEVLRVARGDFGGPGRKGPGHALQGAVLDPAGHGGQAPGGGLHPGRPLANVCGDVLIGHVQPRRVL
jgi:hypothetical protein